MATMSLICSIVGTSAASEEDGEGGGRSSGMIGWGLELGYKSVSLGSTMGS